jgi:hypothetical protein
MVRKFYFFVFLLTTTIACPNKASAYSCWGNAEENCPPGVLAAIYGGFLFATVLVPVRSLVLKRKPRRLLFVWILLFVATIGLEVFRPGSFAPSKWPNNICCPTADLWVWGVLLGGLLYCGIELVYRIFRDRSLCP